MKKNSERGLIGMIVVLIAIIIVAVLALEQMGYLDINEDKIEEIKEKPQETIDDFKDKIEEIEEKIQK